VNTSNYRELFRLFDQMDRQELLVKNSRSSIRRTITNSIIESAKNGSPKNSGWDAVAELAIELLEERIDDLLDNRINTVGHNESLRSRALNLRSQVIDIKKRITES